MKRLDGFRIAFFAGVPVLFAAIGLRQIGIGLMKLGLRWATGKPPRTEAFMYGNAAHVYAISGLASEAIEMLHEAHKRHPFENLNMRIALAYEESGDLGQSREYYRRALTDDSVQITDADRAMIEAKLQSRGL